jgi:hypothetical protein
LTNLFLRGALADVFPSPHFAFGARDAVFAVTFYRAGYPLMAQAVMVMLPALWGMRLGSGRGRVGFFRKGVTLGCICVNVPPKESTVLNWLLHLWRGLGAWLTQRPTEQAYHYPVARPYQPSNLHTRHH